MWPQVKLAEACSAIRNRATSPGDTIDRMRRGDVAGVGAVVVVLGFLLLTGVEVVGPGAAVLGLLLVPVGFLLLWESLVTWPRDGTGYPWRRRAAGGAGMLLGLVVVVGLHWSGRALFPENWLAATLTHTAAIAAGVHLFLWLRRHVIRRLPDPTTAPSPNGRDQ